MKDIKAKILKKKQYSDTIFEFVLHAPYIAETAAAGQFVEVAVKGAGAPLLRRPFGIKDADAKAGTISILFKAVGRGTEILGAKQEGCELNVLGPLGKGFKIEKDKNHILVAGGLGVPPIFFLAKKIAEAGEKVYTFIGARTKSEIAAADDFLALGCELGITTDDGSMGEKCLVSVPMERKLKDLKDPVIYACGPHKMLESLAHIAESVKVPLQVSLEEKMACGLGVCRGCPVQVKNADTKYKMVCQDGPVFNAEDIVW
ncbi:dihydroorotate dehydrogenase electron transfer subunit [Parelusimicrobium proximum]|uniref:dihydroorotate dehydrogenase electron transfer subunit n=1 Tax=Parelusimicrobium proximum TaxID=3228953 RepID=UPI003D185DB0